MRRGRLIQTLTTAAIFLILEAFAVMLIARGSASHRTRLQGMADRLNHAVWKQTDQIGRFFDYRKENERLARENLALRNALSAREAQPTGADSSVMPNLIGHPSGRYSYILATVIHNSTGSQRNHLMLDRGSDDGVKEGSAVITADGVVGVVSVVERRYCRVESFLNTTQCVSARIEPCGAFGLLRWSGRSQRRAVLTEIPMHTQAAEGDTVRTSGYSAIYPPGIPLGVIRSISSDGSSMEMQVELFQNFNALRYVYIVTDRDAQTLKELSHAR